MVAVMYLLTRMRGEGTGKEGRNEGKDRGEKGQRKKWEREGGKRRGGKEREDREREQREGERRKWKGQGGTGRRTWA